MDRCDQGRAAGGERDAEGPGGRGGEARFPYPAAEQVLHGGGVSRDVGVGVLEEVDCGAELVCGGERVDRSRISRLRLQSAPGLRAPPHPAWSAALPTPAPRPAAPPPRPVVPVRSLRADPAPRSAAQLRAGALLPGDRGVRRW
ncbi:hypothetical protein Stsp02_72690 [Streptomyces sp. NBRC 14336]|nr:hypothetical protein Stsp02_72690 [Streptomyces sp. NBRC 14336]